MRHLKSLILCLSIACSHADPGKNQSPEEETTQQINRLAKELHHVAQSQDDIDTRVDVIENLINAIETYVASTSSLTQAQLRYLMLLECIGLDVYKHLLPYQGQFALESNFKCIRPSDDTVETCVNDILQHDLQNTAFKELLKNLITEWRKKDCILYKLFATKLEAFGQTLAGDEKTEFDTYRMILGPQRIVLPE